MARDSTMASPANGRPSDRLPKAFVDAVDAHFAPLDEAAPGLAAKATRFVLEGAPVDLLDSVLEYDRPGWTLALTDTFGHGFSREWDSKVKPRIYDTCARRRRLLESGMKVDEPDVWVRFAKLELALAQPGYFAKWPRERPWPHWFARFLEHAVLTTRTPVAAPSPEVPFPGLAPIAPISARMLADMLAVDGHPADLLAYGLLCLPDSSASGWLNVIVPTTFEQTKRIHLLRACVSDLPEYLARNLDTVRASITNRKPQVGAMVIHSLREMQFDFRVGADFIVDIALGPSKHLGRAAAAVLADTPGDYTKLLHERLANGNAKQRNEAARLLWEFFGKAVREVLVEQEKKDKSARVKQTIRFALA